MFRHIMRVSADGPAALLHGLAALLHELAAFLHGMAALLHGLAALMRLTSTRCTNNDISN